MDASLDLTGIALVALAALAAGLLLTRLKQPAVLGYVLAGVILGPSCFSLIENRESVSLLAELGVLLLLFSIGMELNLRAFREVWIISVGCVLLQVLGSLGMIFIASFLFHWSLGTTLLIGFIIALSSTAVSVTMLENVGELKTAVGRLTISILIAQDLAFVPMTLIIRSFGDQGFDYMTVLKLIISIVVLVVLILYLSRKERVHIPVVERAARHREIFPILGLAFCFGAAALAGLFGISAAYGAFLAGMILGNTAERHRIIKVTHPTQSILLMVFFVSVGLLMDLEYIYTHFMMVATVLLVVFICKTALNVTILKFLGQPLATAFLSSLMLAQIGEFSFVMATIGMQVHILDPSTSRLVIAVTALSLLFSPIWMETARRLRRLGSNSRTLSTFWRTMKNLYQPETNKLKPLLKKLREGHRQVLSKIKITRLRRKKK